MDPASTVDWIALNLLPGLGSISARRAVDRYGDPAEIAYRLPVDEIRALGRIAVDELPKLARARRDLKRRAEREFKRAAGAGITILPLAHPDYPAALAEITDAPVVLYVRGTLASPVVRLAVVGSRTPTPYGNRLAAGLAGQLAARGIEVVSGGARGIDSRAHEGALAEAGGRKVAVLGSGLARLYPPENEKLFERIATNGAVISEFPLDYPPLGENFLRRNRIISGLSVAVVVVEAAEKSRAVAFLSCHPEGTEATSGRLAEGARDPRRPPTAASAQAGFPPARCRPRPRRPREHRGDLGAEPEGAVRAAGRPDHRVPRLLPVEAGSHVRGAPPPGPRGPGPRPARVG